MEAIRAQKTITELGQLYHINPNLVAKWKKRAMEGLPEVYGQPHNSHGSVADAAEDELFKQIGQLKVEIGVAQKKNLDLSIEQKRRSIGPHPPLTIERQCQLLALSRSTYYHCLA